MDKEEIELTVAKEDAELYAVEQLMLEYMNFNSDGSFDKITPANMRAYLINVENVPEEYFLVFNKTKKQMVPSFDVTVLNRLIKYNICPYLLELYSAYQEMNSKTNILSINQGALMETKFKAFDNRPLYQIPFYYTMESTGRIYSKAVDVQGLPIKYANLQKALKDYFLLWGDFSQIDLRVALQLCLMGDESLKRNIEKYPDDRYEGFARTMYESKNMVFNPEQFVEDRENRFKPGILAPVYGMSESNVCAKVGDSSIGSSIYHYINSNPSYKEYKNNIKKNIQSGVDFYVQTYFGTKLPISRHTGNIMTACLNKPIQGTSGDIMKIVTCEIYRRMQSHLNDKNLFFPLVNRHDETIFMIHKSAIEYLYEFVDCTDIQLDDWAPLKIKWSAGYRYKQTDDNLVNQINLAVSKHSLTPKVYHMRKQTFTPAPRLLSLGAFVLTYNGVNYTTIQFLDSDTMLSIIDTERTRKVAKIVKYLTQENLINFEDYDRILIYCNFTDYIKLENDIEVIVTDNPDFYNATIFSGEVSHGLAKRYIENQLHETVPEHIKEFANIDTRKEFNYKCLSLI